MTLRATAFVRMMTSGSTRPFVVEADDGHQYVLKGGFGGQDPVVQSCEWLAYQLGRLYEVPVVSSSWIEVSEKLIQQTPQLREERIACGVYYGCRYLYPTQPPDRFVQSVASCRNAGDAPAMILFDHWIHNSDRVDNAENLLFTGSNTTFFHLIDHHNAFYGLLWLEESPPDFYRIYWGRLYQAFVPYMDNRAPFSRAWESLRSIPRASIKKAVRLVPADWGIPANRLLALADYLDESREGLPALMRRHRAHFPGWDGDLR